MVRLRYDCEGGHESEPYQEPKNVIVRFVMDINILVEFVHHEACKKGKSWVGPLEHEPGCEYTHWEVHYETQESVHCGLHLTYAGTGCWKVWSPLLLPRGPGWFAPGWSRLPSSPTARPRLS